MVGILVKAAGQAIAWLLSNPTNVSNTDLADALVGVWNAIKALASFLQTLFGRELDAWDAVAPEIDDGAKGLGELAYDEAGAWDRLLNTIVPNSLRWLDGRTHQWVDAKYDWQISYLWHWLFRVATQVDLINHWRNSWATPNLRRLIGWHTWFDTWPRGVLFTWHDWFRTPWKFAAWATPPLAPALLLWVSVQDHWQLRRGFTRAWLTTAGPLTYEYEQAVVAMLTAPRQ